MKPIRLRARGYRGFEALDFDFPDGLWSIVGDVKDAPPGVQSNGAGKSSLVLACDLALFGAERRSFADYITHGEEELELELTFEHGGETYRARRWYSKRTKQGKPALDLELSQPLGAHDEAEYWKPLTLESIAATQQAITDLLGFNREMFRASSMLLQNQVAFPDLDPSKRKEVIVAGLGLGRWAQAQEAVRTDRRVCETRVSELDGALERADVDLDRLPTVERDVALLTDTVTGALSEYNRAESALADASSRYQEAEGRVAARRTAEAQLEEARARAGGLAQTAHAALEAKNGLPAVAACITALETLVDRGLEIQQANRKLVIEREVWAKRCNERQATLDRADRVEQEIATLTADADARALKATEIGDTISALRNAPGSACDRCGQALHDDALARAIASYDAELTALVEQAVRGREHAATLPHPAKIRDEAGDQPPEPDQTIETPTDVVAAPAELGAARERKAALEARVAAAQEPDFRWQAEEARAALAQAEKTLELLLPIDPAETAQIQQDGLKARADLTAARTALDEQQTLKVRAETELERLRALSVKTAGDRAQRDQQLEALDDLRVLDEAFGRDGVSALIVERVAVPVIEARANEFLGRLGLNARVELHTQRETGAGTREALDIIVVWDAGYRQEFFHFSNGERSRINFALQLGFAELIHSRRNSPIDLFVVDDVAGLDDAGAVALVETLREVNERIPSVCLISQLPMLMEAFETVIEIERSEQGPSGRSRVVGAQVPEAVPA